MPDRKTVRFVSALLRHGVVAQRRGAGFCLETGTGTLGIEPGAVRELVSQGVLALNGEGLHCRPEARSWLRRVQSETDNSYADQHRAVKVDSEDRQVNNNESPVSRLGAQKGSDGAPFLEPHHLEAAQQIRVLFERALLRRSVTLSYDATRTASGGGRSGHQADISDMAIDARSRLNIVWEMLPGDCASAVHDICCLEKGLQLVELERGWPRRSAKLVLRIGLDHVAAHFGLSKIASGPNHAKRMNRWMEGDARPTVVG